MTNMIEEASLELRSRKTDETRNHLLVEIKHNDLTSEKYKTCKYVNYVEHLLILTSTITDSIASSAFASLVCVPVGIPSSSIGLKICAITAGIKSYKSIKQKKRKKKSNTIMLLGKDKLNTTDVLISKALINSYISHDKFVSINVLREYYE